MRLTLWLLALGSSGAALTAQAQKDLASCKTVSDALLKTFATPHHSYSTQTSAGKTQVIESITAANGKNYFQYEGKWRLSPMTVADMVKQEKENIDSATVYKCTATGPGAYRVHTENSAAKYDGDISVQNGLVMRVEQDLDMGAPTKTHVSTKYDYSNVSVPPGV